MTRHLTGVRSRFRAKRAAAIAASALLALTLFTLTVEAGAPEDLDPLLRALSVRPWWGDPPTLALVGLDGQRYALDAFKGRVVLLYFWATW